jgi:hypothetical protein
MRVVFWSDGMYHWISKNPPVSTGNNPTVFGSKQKILSQSVVKNESFHSLFFVVPSIHIFYTIGEFYLNKSFSDIF